MFKQHRRINIQNSQEAIQSLLLNNQYFICQLSENHFCLAENLFLSNKFLHPILKGYLCCSQKSVVTLDLKFELRPTDKVFFVIDILIALITSILSVMCTHTIEIAIIIVAFMLVCFLIFGLVYKYNCIRFYGKFFSLLKCRCN